MRRFIPLLAVLPLAFAPAPLRKAEEGKDEKRFTLAVNGKNWREVLTWLSDVSDQAIVGPVIPGGTCTVAAPPGRRYTLAEVVELLNDDLLRIDRPVRYFLFTRERTFVLVPADEVIDKLPKAPFVRIEDLPRRGRKELAMIYLPLKTLDAAATAVEVRKRLGPFGEVDFDKKNNALMVQDQVGNLDSLVKAIRTRDGAKKPRRPESSKLRAWGFASSGRSPEAFPPFRPVAMPAADLANVAPACDIPPTPNVSKHEATQVVAGERLFTPEVESCGRSR